MRFPRGIPSFIRPFTAVVLATAAVGPAFPDDLDSARDMQESIDEAGQQTQRRIDALSEQAQAMLSEYRNAREEARSLKTYNDQLERLVASQSEEIESMQEQIGTIDETQQEFVPLMLRALDALETFVARDIPFLPEKRESDIAELREVMDRADVSTAERFRQIMATYQDEMEYGRTIETYRGKLELDGSERSVRFLRVGRVALMYQTLDGQRTGRWNPMSDSWEPLESDYRAAMEQGLSIASEQAPPDLLRVPLSVPEASQ